MVSLERLARTTTVRQCRGSSTPRLALTFLFTTRTLGKPYIQDNEEARRVSVDYTMAAAKAFTENTAAKGDRESKFRFIYLSGAAAQRDQTKSAWFMSDYRKIRVSDRTVTLV